MLQSTLFVGDAALQACLVNDRAHVVEGAHGPHVTKIQQALALLDSALISIEEIRAERYGPSTAKAVLDYKRVRRIINFSYQSSPDNIVGKMTIASLDKELTRIQQPRQLRGCLDETRPSATRPEPASTPVAQAITGTPVGAAPGSALVQSAVTQNVGDSNKPVRALRIAFQDALAKDEVGLATPMRTLLLSARARTLLLPFGMTVQGDVLPSFPFPIDIGERDDIDVTAIRKAAEKASAGSNDRVRVIFCSFKPTTSTGTSNGEITGIQGFPNFILVNKNRIHPDMGTLMHEMIHCSRNDLMSDFAHSGDLNNVFSFGPSRTVLGQDHVDVLRGCFFGR